VGGLGDHCCIKSAEKPFMSGYFHARHASSDTIQNWYRIHSGQGSHVKRHTIRQNHARHAYSDHAHKASPIIDTTHPIIVGNWLQSQKILGEKKPPAMHEAQRAEFQESKRLRRSISSCTFAYSR
jgi:hypothetical protein